MKTIANILVGVDLEPDGRDVTPGSRRAASQARFFAARTGARVTLLHSTARDEYWDPLSLGYVIVGVGPPAEGERAMEDLTESFREADVAAELVQTEERPWLALTKEALRGRADLVIVGKRSRSETDGRKLGRVSQRLLRKCPCPLWIVKDTDHEGAQPAPLRRVLAATDLTPVGANVVQHAAFVASHTEAELHVLHVCPIAGVPWTETGDRLVDWIDSGADAAIANARSAMQRELDATPWKGDVKMHVVVHSAADGILSAVQEYEPDLLVMGSVSREGLSGFLIGNTAEWALERADCSLLTVKPDSFVSPVAASMRDELATD